jgi:hypothetical protein
MQSSTEVYSSDMPEDDHTEFEEIKAEAVAVRRSERSSIKYLSSRWGSFVSVASV